MLTVLYFLVAFVKPSDEPIVLLPLVVHENVENILYKKTLMCTSFFSDEELMLFRELNWNTYKNPKLCKHRGTLYIFLTR